VTAYLCVANPRAGDGGAVRRLRRALARTTQISARVVEATTTDEVMTALREAGPTDVPVAAGGDGTINLLVRAMRMCGMAARPLAVLPLGTGNLVAHALGVGSFTRAMRALAAPVTRRYDLFVTSHPSVPVVVASLSVGAESRFVHGFARARREGYWLAFARAAWDTLTPARRLWMSIDGEAFVDGPDAVFNAGVYNYPVYGFGWRVLPGADPRDGMGEAVAYRRRAAWVCALGAAVIHAPLSHLPGVRRRRWQSAVLDTDEPVQVDGDPGPAGRFEIRVEPGALRLIAGDRAPTG
jgi:diacylglycerol kinase (ATP)